MKLAHREFKSDGQHVAAWYVYCPACESAHQFIVENEAAPKDVWMFDGNEEAPTFDPSYMSDGRWWVNEAWEPRICHSYLRAGVWEYLSDCTHDMAGQKVPMIDFPENYRV